MSRILILGSSGFLGYNLSKYFSTSHEVINHVFNKQLHENGVYANLCNRSEIEELFDKIRPDIVIHAAAVTTSSKDTIEKPYLHITDNAIINSLVFEQCYKFKVKHCIFFSCTVMYQSKETPQKETDWSASDEIYPQYYGVGNMKVFSERLCKFYSSISNTKFTAIRHSNIYGPGDKFDLDKCHVAAAMIRKVYEAKNELEIWGDGSPKRDLLYIDDLIDFVDKCLNKQENNFELFNCGFGQAFSIKEIIDVLKDLTNKPDLKLNYNLSKPNIPTTLILNCEKAKSLLDWEPKTSLKDGLKETLEWYKKNE